MPSRSAVSQHEIGIVGEAGMVQAGGKVFGAAAVALVEADNAEAASALSASPCM